MKPEVIFENEYVLGINKPAGLVVHGDGRTTEETLVDWILAEYPELKDVGEPWTKSDGTVIPRPGIVHRLDRETSGVMAIAKTQESFVFLKEAFQKREIQKTYHAFVYGTLTEKQGTIDLPIGKSASDFRLWSAERGARGVLRPAQTAYEVLQEGKDASYVALFPKTGRTHQLRVHMKAINHPIVCDSRYAPKRACILGFTRVALHALSLRVPLPDGLQVVMVADIPFDFAAAKEALGPALPAA